MKWLEGQGGLDAATKMANERAGLIYGAMNANADFYSCPVQESARSNMNIVWRLPSEDLEIVAGGVFWPTAEEDEDGARWADEASDHRLVWLDLVVGRAE